MSNNKASILIVDDDVNTLEYMSCCLSPSYKCSTATSAEDAVKVLAKGDFNVVIADVWMPGRSGLDLCQLVRSRYPGTQVLLMSAVPDLRQEVEAAKRRAFEYLSKPLSIPLLLASIDRALRYQANLGN